MVLKYLVLQFTINFSSLIVFNLVFFEIDIESLLKKN